MIESSAGAAEENGSVHVDDPRSSAGGARETTGPSNPSMAVRTERDGKRRRQEKRMPRLPPRKEADRSIAVN
jgi:hypothetical protein